jgi:hypothetical protein
MSMRQGGSFSVLRLALAAVLGLGAGEIRAQAWERLFDGVTLKGWQATGKGTWTVADSVLTGIMAANNPESYLVSERIAGDFSLRLKFRWTKGNSGVNFRNERKGDLANGIQVDLDGNHSSGWLYDNVKAAYVAQTDSIPKWFKAGEWNDLAVDALGENISVFLNGHKTVAFKDAGGRKAGVFAFQLHVGLAMEVRFKDIEMKDLSASALRVPNVFASGRAAATRWRADGKRPASASFPR